MRIILDITDQMDDEQALAHDVASWSGPATLDVGSYRLSGIVRNVFVDGACSQCGATEVTA